MKKLTKSFFLLCSIAIAATVVLAGCAPESPKPAASTAGTQKISTKLVFGGGSAGGTGTITASAWIEKVKQLYPGSSIDLVPGGTNPNILKLANGELDVILATTSFMQKANKGVKFVPEITKPVPELLAVTNIWDQFFTFTVLKDFPAETIDDVIKNKMKIRFNPGGPKGNTGVVAFEEYLKVVYNLTFKDMEAWGCKIVYGEFNDMAQMIKDGQLDMFSPLTAAPAAAIMELATTTDIKFLTIEDSSIEKMKPYGYVPAIMSKKLYKGMTEDIKTISLPYGIGMSSKVSEEDGYLLTKTICENADYMKKAVSAMEFFNPEKAFTEMGFDLHPGALKYYKEKDWIK